MALQSTNNKAMTIRSVGFQDLGYNLMKKINGYQDFDAEDKDDWND